jgi:hypothetical protein
MNIYNMQTAQSKNVSCRNIFYLVAKLRCTSMYVFVSKLQRSGRIDFFDIFILFLNPAFLICAYSLRLNELKHHLDFSIKIT